MLYMVIWLIEYLYIQNESLEVKESNPKIELVEIKRKIPGLIEQLGHGKMKWAKEKQILKELEHLQRREVLLDGKIKEAESKIPFSIHRPRHNWYYGSMNKYDLKQHLHRCLKEIKDFEEQEKVAKMQRIPQMVELEKQISSLENKHNILKQEEQITKDCLLALEIQVKKQIALYERYCKLQKKAQELATQKKLDTLEKLSLREIEEFMSRWTNDDEFRANYIRSIELSLANRDLCSDGRMLLDPSEMIIASSTCTI
ncbi:proton pump-interactor 2-like [Chenopodium quinoa]|uniref:proton pump-interactor 2-like n=1 Tax=Chenopodium quinoa TaxID=63459 RepID=UPI000B788A11|nr:proton pump-interactor 2-like [Chenopodium quinoa]